MNIGCDPQQGLADVGPVERPEVEIGNLQEGEHLDKNTKIPQHEASTSASAACLNTYSSETDRTNRWKTRQVAMHLPAKRCGTSTYSFELLRARRVALERAAISSADGWLFDPAATPDLLAKVTDDRLARGDTELRLIEATMEPPPRQQLDGGRHAAAVVADFHPAAERSVGRIHEPIGVGGGQIVARQFGFRANDNAAASRLQAHDEPGLAHSHAQSFALPNGEPLQPVVTANLLAIGRDNRAGRGRRTDPRSE